ncbi:adenylate kinase family protein isoform X1 [Wolffia australiana]
MAHSATLAGGAPTVLELRRSSRPASTSPSSVFSGLPSLSRSRAFSLGGAIPRPASSRSVRREAKSSTLRCSAGEPLKVMISGAPASGKGTQCEMIVKKYGLVHISTGDLLRAEVASGTEIGKKAKEYMENGFLVPDEVVIAMVVDRLSRKDVKEKGWLLDGFPRSQPQAESLERLKIRPDIFIVLDVPDEILINRCVGRRLDPVTGRIYHIENVLPETEEIKARLVTRADDSLEKVKSRLETYKRNANSVASTYKDVMVKIEGNCGREIVFKEIETLLMRLLSGSRENTTGGEVVLRKDKTKISSPKKEQWRGIPTRLNNIPHSREIREYFYNDVIQATQRALEDKKIRLKVDINIPELNPETDVYRIGTLLELVRGIALTFADDGKRVKVCVQGSMGEGALAGMPLQLAGTRKILEFMDWGDYEAAGTFIKIGSIGAKEVEEQDDMFILVAPQNAVGNCIIDDLKAMTEAAGQRPVILINPRLKDLPSSSGIMQAMGRDERMEFAASFENCYFFRLLYYAGTQYPIMGAIRMTYPSSYELFRRVDIPSEVEKYVSIRTFPKRPTADEVNDAFEGKSTRKKEKAGTGIWGFLSGIF